MTYFNYRSIAITRFNEMVGELNPCGHERKELCDDCRLNLINLLEKRIKEIA